MLKSTTEPFVHKLVRDECKDGLCFRVESGSHNRTLTPETTLQLQTSNTGHFNGAAEHKKTQRNYLIILMSRWFESAVRATKSEFD